MTADSLSLTTRKFAVFRRSTLPTPASRKPVTVSCLQAARDVLQRIVQHTQSSLLRSETAGAHHSPSAQAMPFRTHAAYQDTSTGRTSSPMTAIKDPSCSCTAMLPLEAVSQPNCSPLGLLRCCYQISRKSVSTLWPAPSNKREQCQCTSVGIIVRLPAPLQVEQRCARMFLQHIQPCGSRRGGRGCRCRALSVSVYVCHTSLEQSRNVVLHLVIGTQAGTNLALLGGCLYRHHFASNWLCPALAYFQGAGEHHESEQSNGSRGGCMRRCCRGVCTQQVMSALRNAPA